MREVFENASHLEPGMWLTLISLMVVSAILIANLPRLLHMSFAFEMHQQVKQEKKQLEQRKAQHMQEQQEPVDPQSNPGLVDINPPPLRKTNSFWREIKGKSFGILLIVCLAILRYLIEIHPEDVDYSLRWQTHAAFGVMIFFTWIFGLTRKNYQLGDVLVNILFVLWAYYLFR